VIGVDTAVPVVFENLAGEPVAPDISLGDGGLSGAGGAGCDDAVGGQGAPGLALPIACCVLADNGTTCQTLAACEVP
jgi:hypothetical protein